MNKIYYIIIAVVLCAGLFVGGWATHCATTQAKIVIKPGPIQWKTKVITRVITKMTPAEKDKDLECFYTAKPKLDILQYEPYKIRVNAGLCDREWSRDAKIKVYSDKNWAIYLSVGMLVGTAVTVGSYYIYQKYK